MPGAGGRTLLRIGCTYGQIPHARLESAVRRPIPQGIPAGVWGFPATLWWGIDTVFGTGNSWLA